MSEAGPVVARDSVRLVAFSDGVFAITITLLVLEIRPPTGDESLLHGVAALWPSYLSYAVLGVAVIVAFNAFYWPPIRGESPLGETEHTSA